jgi:thiol-disulfide isomerase/thioredoxin
MNPSASAPPKEEAALVKPALLKPATKGRSPLRRILSAFGNLALFLVLYLVLQTTLGWIRAPTLPEQAPAFALFDLEGRKVSLSDFAGQTVVLNFWATWCGPCRIEIPSFARFAEDHPEIPVLGIAVDGGADVLFQARDDLGMSYPVLLADQETLRAYAVTSLPTTVVVRGDGSVRSVHVGMLFRPQLWWMTR